MSKNCLIVTVTPAGTDRQAPLLRWNPLKLPFCAAQMAVLSVCFCALPSDLFAQETGAAEPSVPAAPAPTQESPEPEESQAASSPDYPLSVTIGPDSTLVVVDLNLPGVWSLPISGGKPSLMLRGSNRFREPMNRPRCCALLSDGTLLVGDTATREIYAISPGDEAAPRPLTDGYLGVPVSLAVDPNDNIYIADLESRFVYRLEKSGGKPELYSKTLARGLFHTGTELWAVTPTAEPLIKIAADSDAEVVVGERAFQFPHNVVVLDDGTAFVTDGYAKTVWRVAGDEAPEAFFAGDPLVNPVGLAHQNGKLYVADPHAKQVFEIDIETKAIRPLVN